MFYRDTDYQKVATWLHFNLNFRFWKCRGSLSRRTNPGGQPLSGETTSVLDHNASGDVSRGPQRENLCQPTSSVRPTGRNSPRQKFWRKWCLLCCSGTPSSSPQLGAATEGSLQQSMSSTECSNVVSPHQCVEPTSEPETAILEDVKLKLSRSEAVEFQTAPEETPELHQATMPVPSYESTWPSSVTVEKVLIKYKTQLWIFQPKLVAEQLMLTDNENTSASMLDEPCNEQGRNSAEFGDRNIELCLM
ncbi:uncharacterized protein isoform X2 [Castor canadensis]